MSLLPIHMKYISRGVFLRVFTFRNAGP